MTHHVTRAYAKINLLLRVLARDTGGYHGVETLLQRLDLHDVVRIDVAVDERTLTCGGPAMPRDGLGAAEDNLAWRAADAYAKASAWETGWSITIDKHIPVGGGLGGGSADAGAVLRALEALCPQPIGTTALLALAGTLGADVPFLTTDATLALGWSRGDRLLALPPLPRMAVTLVACSEGVNTGAAYAALAAARRQRAHAIEARAYACDAFASWDSVCALAVNDFEDVVMSLHREVAATLPALRAVAARLNNAGTRALALMSGSGATCALIHPAGTDVALNGIAASRLRHTATSG